MLPEERTTPAGRFVAERGQNLRGEDVVWIDYDAAVLMHRVITTSGNSNGGGQSHFLRLHHCARGIL